MSFLLIPIAIAAIVFFCWLLFTLAIFAMPFFVGLNIGIWAYHTGAGWLGAILVGMVAGGLTLGIGRLLLTFARPLRAKLTVVAVFVAPAVVAGYHVVHGIVKHAMPSEIWQIAFSVIGAVLIGIAAFLRVAGTTVAVREIRRAFSVSRSSII